MTRTWRSEAYELRVARRKQCKLKARARRNRKRKLRVVRSAKRNRDEGDTEQGSEA